ncbi:MAG TPA: malto-oligosyltrehalose trehalohydrolase [Ornithinibacter sp.]|nr:malto-oligosyltrehalose trehalohydrolase [Ornithinibacter sp.]
MPTSTSRSLGVQQRRAAMTPAGDGWWRWEPGPDALGDGTASGPVVLDYAFLLDGAEPALPDPRSAWQPHGVHGASRVFDPSTFAWSDDDWRGPRSGTGVLGSVVYELHIGTFTPEGTLDAALTRLDHLVELGVDVVELMPVAAFPGRWGWGYDGVGLWAVHDGYGGPAALQRFVEGCHALGLGVALDVVHNHLGASGNYLARFGPYFTQAHHTPWGPAVNLDHEGCGPVRQFLVESTLRWFRDFHVDALRLDAVHELKDDSRPHYLAELSDAVAALAAQLGRPLDLIAESDLNDTVMVTPTADAGRGMTAQWNDDVHHALHVALTGEAHGYYADFAGGGARDEAGPLGVLAKVLTRGFLHDGTMSTFRSQPWGSPVDVEHLDARRLLGYLQTHDQVGNRMAGDRMSAAITPGLQAAGAALYLLGPTTPMIFMGEEWAASTPWQFFTSFDDEVLADAVRRGRRAEFGAHGWSADAVPDPQDPATRDASVLDWSEAGTGEHARTLQWYAACTALRRDLIPPGPTRFADVDVTFDEGARWLVMVHAPAGGRPYVVAVNLAATPQTVPLPAGEPELILAWDGADTTVREGAVRMPAGSAAVLRLT